MNSDRLLALYRQIFVKGILIQAALTLALFSGVLFLLYHNTLNLHSGLLDQEISHINSKLTEVLFVSEVNDSSEVIDEKTKQYLRNQIKGAGIDAKIDVGACVALRTSANSKIYSFKIGERILKNCLAVTPDYSNALGIIVQLFLIAIVSVLIGQLIWFFQRRRVAEDVLDPLINEIREGERIQNLAEIATQVAHDIRSPITALKVVSEADELRPETKQILVAASKRVGEIAEDLLNKYKSSKKDLIPESHISAIFLELKSEKRVHIESKKLDVNLKINPTSNSRIQVSLVDLKRTLSNILQNAIEASYDNGEISISSEVKNGNFRLTIEDHGKGIPKEHLEEIGRRGFTYGKAEGTGLGLWQVKRFAEEALGRIEIQSSLEHGTSVVLVLPSVSVTTETVSTTQQSS